MELAEAINSGEPPLLVDCRSPEEFALGAIDKAVNIPLDRISELIDSIEEPPSGIVVYCHKGVRSLAFTAMLLDAGYDDVRSLDGGIDLWSVRVDDRIPRY